MINAALMLIAAFLLIGCSKSPESTDQVNAVFTVDTLFVKDDCTVYRFADDGRYVYYTNCKGNTQWRQNCGKNCSRPVGVSGGEQ